MESSPFVPLGPCIPGGPTEPVSPFSPFSPGGPGSPLCPEEKVPLVINHYSTITTWNVFLSGLWFSTSLPITEQTTAYALHWETQKAQAETILNSFRLVFGKWRIECSLSSQRTIARKEMAKIHASFLLIKQTNLVYLSYLADLRKKKKKRVRKLHEWNMFVWTSIIKNALWHRISSKPRWRKRPLLGKMCVTEKSAWRDLVKIGLNVSYYFYIWSFCETNFGKLRVEGNFSITARQSCNSWFWK